MSRNGRQPRCQKPIVLTTIRQLLAVERPGRLRGYGYLFLMTVANSALEVIGIAMVLPLIAIVANPASIDTYPWLQSFKAVLVLTDWSDMVVALCGVFLAVILIKNVYAILFSYVLLTFVTKGAEDLSRRLFNYYLGLPYLRFLQRNSAEMINAITRQARGAYTVVSTALITLWADAAVAVSIFGFLMLERPEVVISSLAIAVPLFVLQNRIYARRLIDAGAGLLQASEQQIFSLQDSFRSVREVRIYGRVGYVLDAFQKIQEGFSHNWMTTQILSRLPALVAEVVLAFCVSAALIYLVLSQEDIGGIFSTLGLLAAALHRLVPVLNRMLNNANLLNEHRTAIAALNADISEADRLAADESPACPLAIPFQQAIELDRLSFRFPNSRESILTDASLRIERGQIIGLAGRTGSGKSTLVNLLAGLFDPTSGRVLVDGRDIQGSQREWQRNIAYVPQTVFISDSSVRENVALGAPDRVPDDKRIWTILDQVKLRSVVERMPDGLSTRLGELGTRLSGGQAQRLGLARALYTDRPVIVLDEATSALDNVTEREIGSVISGLRGARTVILIAHRLQTLRMCDRIVFLDGGRVAAVDTFEQLTKQAPDFFIETDRREGLNNEDGMLPGSKSIQPEGA